MKKILIVDDDVNVLTLLQKRISVSGYEVETARNGVEGLEKAKRSDIDLVVLDVLMPDMDGYSLVHELRSDVALRDIPLIVVTAKIEMKDLFLGEGVSAVFEKPFKVDEILQKMAELLVS